MAYYVSSAVSYISSSPSYLYSSITDYIQPSSPPSPLKELGQAIEKAFGDVHTSNGLHNESVSELSILADVVFKVRNDGIGLLKQIEKAKEAHLVEHTETIVPLSKSASLSVFKERAEVISVAKIAALDKLFVFIQQNLSLIREVDSLSQTQSIYILSRDILSHDIVTIVDAFTKLDLKSLKEEKLNAGVDDFTNTEHMQVTPPIETSVWKKVDSKLELFVIEDYSV